jgi:16S rRNA (guanine527-N7)-methyltransferase
MHPRTYKSSSDSAQPLSLREISLALAPFMAGTHLSAIQLEKIGEYVELLVSWNRALSLTAIDDRTEIVARHFGESILAASAVPIRHGRLADVGSGAGFPGLPLKIVCEGLDVVLLEPNHKKCAFLNEVVRKLALKSVEVHSCGYEEYSRGASSPLDFVCSRALGGYRRLLRWAKTALDREGQTVLWLGEQDSILVGKTSGWTWNLPIRIPESSRRVLQVGRPMP